MNIKNTILFLFFAMCFSVNGQLNRIDSLKKKLLIETNDSAKVAICNLLCEEVNESEILYYNKIMHDISINYIKKNASAISLVNFYGGALGNCLINDAYFLNINGNYLAAIQKTKLALKIFEIVNNQKSIGAALNNLSSYYLTTGNTIESIKCINKVIYIYESIGEVENLYNFYNNLGFIHYKQKETKTALEFYFKSLALSSKLEDSIALGNVLGNIGFIHKNENHLDSAEYYFKKSYSILKKQTDLEAIAYTINNLANIYLLKHQPDSATLYCNMSIKIRTERKDLKGLCYSYISNSKIYSYTNNLDKAIQELEKAYTICKQINFIEGKKETSLLLSGEYTKQKNFLKASEYYNLFINYKDSLLNNETKRAALNAQMKYEFESQAVADSIQYSAMSLVRNLKITEQNKLIAVKRNTTYFLFTIILLCLVFSIFLYKRYKLIVKQKKLIEEQKKITESQKKLIEEKQKETLDSIIYAKRIQLAFLPSNFKIKKTLNAK